MKPTRFLTIALVLLGLVAMVNAAGTPAGTVIQNQAKGAYNDANGNEVAGETEGYVFSNTVSTTVAQVAGADAGDDQALNLTALSSVLYPVIFTNTGNGTDTFTLGVTASGTPTGTFTYEIWHDADSSGTINAGDTEVTSTGALAADAEFYLLIKVIDATSGGAPEGDQVIHTLLGTSTFNSSVNDAAVLTTTVQAATLVAEITAGPEPLNPVPGAPITYAICITNNGTATAYNVVFTNGIPAYTSYQVNTIRTGTTGWDTGSAITDADDSPTDEGNYNATTDTITVNLGTIAGGASICVYYKVTIDADVPEGTDIPNDPVIEFENGGGTPYDPVDPTGDTTVEVVESFGVDIASTGTTSFTGDPSDSLFYPFSVENLGNGTDNFNLTSSSDYVVWTFYADDGDGILSTAELAAGAITVTGDLTQNEVANFVAVGIIPAGTADTAVDNTTFTATSQGDGSETDTDTADATCTAPVVTLSKSSPQGYDIAEGESVVEAAPGATITYTIIVTNTGTGQATSVIVTDAIPDYTTYVDDSMTLDSSPVDDDDDADGAAYTGTAVVWDLGSMAASGSHTLTFQVTIDDE